MGSTEVARATHLADTSAFGRFQRPQVREAAIPMVASGRVALCAPVIFELGFSARNAAEYDEIMMRAADFDLISDITGQPTEWIVERGTAD
ncbi:hypothetical protein [Candidatus Poriferisodalis sp.]|uniref:hypothetical protein n=1 Tax=Candidatus Poriferisodalis sp. TaxID=3101277 RepID=UPI003AF8B326